MMKTTHLRVLGILTGIILLFVFGTTISLAGPSAPHADTLLQPDASNASCFEEASSAWTKKGSWMPMFRDAASGGVYLSYASSRTGWQIYLDIEVSGESFGLVYHKSPFGGIANVFVDDLRTPYAQIDMYAPYDLWLSQSFFEVDGLDPDETHTVRIVPSGKKNPASRGYSIDIDRLDMPGYTPEFNDNCLQ